MEQLKTYMSIAWVILLAVLIQGLLILADCKDSPNRVAVGFARAYYDLDSKMADFMCSDMLTQTDGNIVERYLQKTSREADQRGFDISYMKSILYGIETHTHMIDSEHAEVRLHAKRRTSINPIFALIGKFFLIGETHVVDETIPVVKKDGRWKICETLFSLSKV